ncbi:MAG: hypothetical protein C9356_19780 [Oleiphilus sp.]|nr:MAG: hypothetical protein C9356_19780 [Oleiphilus sp.]
MKFWELKQCFECAGSVPEFFFVVGYKQAALPRWFRKLIAQLADQICGNISSKGSSTNETVSFYVDPNDPSVISEIKNSLGGQFDNIEVTEGTVTVTTSSYQGIKQDQLAEHNSAVRKCRQDISMMAISGKISLK